MTTNFKKKLLIEKLKETLKFVSFCVDWEKSVFDEKNNLSDNIKQAISINRKVFIGELAKIKEMKKTIATMPDFV